MEIKAYKNNDKNSEIPALSVKELAERAGFSLCGIAPYRILGEHRPRLEGWLAEGRHGSLGYMEREPGRRLDPSFVFPGTRTVVVCAATFRNSAWDIPADGRPKIASYAWARDYHQTIKDMISGVLDGLRERYPGLKGRVVTDTAPLLEKAWAVEAGLGWIGRNSLLVTPRYGTSVMLGEMLIDAPVDRYDTPFTREGCGNCRRCVDACPTRAIGPDRTIDASRCISRLTVEPGADELFGLSGGMLPSLPDRHDSPQGHLSIIGCTAEHSGPANSASLPDGGSAPEGAALAGKPVSITPSEILSQSPTRPLGGWVFGCDGCQVCCPHNRAVPCSTVPGFRPVMDPAAFDTAFCRSVSLETFTRLFRHTPLERPGLEKVYKRIKALCGPVTE